MVNVYIYVYICIYIYERKFLLWCVCVCEGSEVSVAQHPDEKHLKAREEEKTAALLVTPA